MTDGYRNMAFGIGQRQCHLGVPLRRCQVGALKGTKSQPFQRLRLCLLIPYRLARRRARQVRIGLGIGAGQDVQPAQPQIQTCGRGAQSPWRSALARACASIIHPTPRGSLALQVRRQRQRQVARVVPSRPGAAIAERCSPRFRSH